MSHLRRRVDHVGDAVVVKRYSSSADIDGDVPMTTVIDLESVVVRLKHHPGEVIEGLVKRAVARRLLAVPDGDLDRTIDRYPLIAGVIRQNALDLTARFTRARPAKADAPRTSQIN